MLPRMTGFLHSLFQILLPCVVNNLGIWNNPPKSQPQLYMLNTSLSNPSFSHLHWSLVSGPSLRVDRSCRGPHLPSPQTTCLSLGLLACNLRQSSKSKVERVWLYVFDSDSHLSQCFAPWAAWVPQSRNSLRSSAARDGEIQKTCSSNSELRTNSFYVLWALSVRHSAWTLQGGALRPTAR